MGDKKGVLSNSFLTKTNRVDWELRMRWLHVRNGYKLMLSALDRLNFLKSSFLASPNIQSKYRRVATSRLSQLVAHSRIFRLFIKRKFDAYVLWPLAKIVQNWIVDRPTASNFTVPYEAPILGQLLDLISTPKINISEPRFKSYDPWGHGKLTSYDILQAY